MFKKLVTYEEVRYQIKSLSFYLLDQRLDTEDFIADLLQNVKRPPVAKEAKKLRVKNTLSIENFVSIDSITVEEISFNLDKLKI